MFLFSSHSLRFAVGCAACCLMFSLGLGAGYPRGSLVCGASTILLGLTLFCCSGLCVDSARILPALSDTTTSGSPCVVKSCLKFEIATADDVVGTGRTSNHLEYESTTTRNVLPWHGPAKSICKRHHG
ncbi:hypothetical protein T07_1397 [Trichinella nelsoni]|uniref:Uncharacterized protein n=1 Tax=Trichinella nelsoni TaxID=6336 RepID=A0A0V0SMB6_9BILA|nr:hypothetical protein T07_12012 [Trichinella nelsoni]KRX28000.1 hypothetical protein T07_1397 [Trichinella nelsoni]